MGSSCRISSFHPFIAPRLAHPTHSRGKTLSKVQGVTSTNLKELWQCQNGIRTKKLSSPSPSTEAGWTILNRCSPSLSFKASINRNTHIFTLGSLFILLIINMFWILSFSIWLEPLTANVVFRWTWKITEYHCVTACIYWRIYPLTILFFYTKLTQCFQIVLRDHIVKIFYHF